ncbi:MAG: hypothetical protein AAEJ52_08805 [Myxococcota bacterium]|jgi:hypothetical protein
MNLTSVRKLIMALPRTEEVTSHGTPARKAGRKLIALAKVDSDDLEDLVVDAWRDAAPRKLVAAYDATE